MVHEGKRAQSEDSHMILHLILCGLSFSTKLVLLSYHKLQCYYFIKMPYVYALCPTVCLVVCLSYCLSTCLVNYLTVCLTGSLHKCLIDWLSDCKLFSIAFLLISIKRNGLLFALIYECLGFFFRWTMEIKEVQPWSCCAVSSQAKTAWWRLTVWPTRVVTE